VIRVEVVRAWTRRHASVALQLADGATVADALQACGLAQEGISGHAVFGERVGRETMLHDGDRLELLPPLQADPKEARRRRANRG
jgi:putative ubiquitin-RnfH superfamily antitoxin RatB of RatAB toxin-antitoxin module